MTHVTRPHQSPDRSLVRRAADGGQRTAPSWEALSERLIREAIEAGRFDELPARGQRLDLADDSFAGERALAHHLLRNAGVAPPWIEADKQIRDIRDHIEALLVRAGRSQRSAVERLQRELEALVDADAIAVRRLDCLAPTPRQQRCQPDRTRLHEQLMAALPPDPEPS